MKMYNEYKPSIYPWLYSIPAHWEERFLQSVCVPKCKKNDENCVTTVLSLSYGRIIRKQNIYAGLVAKDFSTYQIVQNGDIILRFTDLQNDHKSLRTGLVTETGIITSAYTCITPRINSAYLHYLLHAYDLQKVFYGMGAGVRQSIGFKDVRHMFVQVPPRPEQDQIVRFLDWKVSSVNKLISVKRKQIALLHERQGVHISHIVTHGLRNGVAAKDSGAEWLGDIPEHWRTMRCKYLFSERDERSQDGSEQHLSMSQKYGLVADSQLDERRMLSESYVGGKLCNKDDLVLNRLKAHLGVFALAPQSGVISPDYTVLRPNTERILPSFAETVLKSDCCRGELHIRVRGIIEGFWRLYTDDFNTIVLPVPPLDEQAEIMEYIVEFHDKAKKYEDTLTQEISSLQELKARLISDTVTGKIDVRGIQIPEYEFAKENNDTENNESMEEMEGGIYEE